MQLYKPPMWFIQKKNMSVKQKSLVFSQFPSFVFINFEDLIAIDSIQKLTKNYFKGELDIGVSTCMLSRAINFQKLLKIA